MLQRHRSRDIISLFFSAVKHVHPLILSSVSHIWGTTWTRTSSRPRHRPTYDSRLKSRDLISRSDATSNFGRIGFRHPTQSSSQANKFSFTSHITVRTDRTRNCSAHGAGPTRYEHNCRRSCMGSDHPLVTAETSQSMSLISSRTANKHNRGPLIPPSWTRS